MRLDRPIETPRLRLESFEPDQVDAGYLGWLDDPQATRFTEVRPGAYDAARARAYVAGNLESPDALLLRIIAPDGASKGAPDGPEGPHNGQERAIGTMRLSGLAGPHRCADLALMIGAARARGRGYGTEAIRGAAEAAFARFDLHKICAGIYAPNEASRRAFEKAGFHLEARLVEQVFFESAFVDVLKMARFADGRRR